MPEYATVTTLPRYNHTLSGFHLYDSISPMSSAPPTAHNSRAPSPEPEYFDPPRFAFDSLKWRLASGYFACFVTGWADGVTGTVMPYLSAEFKLTTMTSSLLWAGTTCGFFIGTFLVEIILKWLGRFSLESSKKSIIPHTLIIFNKKAPAVGHSASHARHLALVIAGVMHAFYFIMMGSRGGFPVMFVAYAMAAFARALLTGKNAYFASGPKQALGYAYGLASFGSVASPFVCQSIIATGVPWFHFYYGSLVLSALNIMFLAFTFKPSLAEFTKDRQGALSEARMKLGGGDAATDSEKTSPIVMSPNSSAVRLQLEEAESNKKNTLKMALRMPYQWAFSAFALLYCGSETTTQGFMVTYLLGSKHANPKTVGYVTSGFWGGISLGRFAFGYCNEYLSFTQRKHVVHLCIFLGLVLQILVWVVRSHVQNSIAAGFIGLFYGPVFPGALAMANDVLPEDVHMVVMALINAFASLGGAVFPVITGTVLSFEGVSSFTFVTVPLAASLAVLWGLFPSRIPNKFPTFV
ncbi:MFS general substrate transporter [Macrolepiota fuliginosa MF-IS2]|uniref:MFS general substrate transporter n=1 Tax=Macrolepiota fuliginosa MF-IS2 TaxID=1400762 RepID=A0A9P5XLL0_9AGAR|nr:MFS general substrate transporter [Macrolepiota fuliginosa MF-IS2]